MQSVEISVPLTITIDQNEIVAGLTIGAGSKLAIIDNANGNGSLIVSGTVDDGGLIRANSTGSDPSVTFTSDVPS